MRNAVYAEANRLLITPMSLTESLVKKTKTNKYVYLISSPKSLDIILQEPLVSMKADFKYACKRRQIIFFQIWT